MGVQWFVPRVSPRSRPPKNVSNYLAEKVKLCYKVNTIFLGLALVTDFLFFPKEELKYGLYIAVRARKHAQVEDGMVWYGRGL